MPKRYETSITIDAQTKGFESAQQKTSKLSEDIGSSLKSNTKGFVENQKQASLFGKELDKLGKVELKGVQKQLGTLQGNLSDLHKEQAKVLKSLLETDKASDGYKKLEDQLKNITRETKSTERQINKLTKAYSAQFREAEKAAKQAEQARGAFVQGLAQGGLPFPAPFLQRGPGMGRQLAGMAIGRGVMGGARGVGAVGSGMLGGVGGLTRMISTIPLIGGAAAAQFQTAAGYAQQHIQWEKTKLGLAPYLENAGSIAERRQRQLANSKAVQEAKKTKERISGDRSLLEETQKLYREEADRLADNKTFVGRVKNAALGKEDTPKEQYAKIMAKKFIDNAASEVGKGSGLVIGDPRKAEVYKTAQEYRDAASQIDAFVKIADKAVDKADAALLKAEAATAGGGPDLFGDITRLGLDLMGVSKTEAAKFAGGVAQAGGGTVADIKAQGMLGASMAAKTLLGVGPEVSGAFLRGGRRGGLVGGGDKAGAALTEAIASGYTMGFSRSENATWLQQIAQGIQQFQATGIPINANSIKELEGEISKSGITGTRALAMAGGLAGGLQQVGTRGIKSGLDHILLQIFGGYKGGGAMEYLTARSKMQKLDFKGKGVGAIAGDKGMMGGLGQFMDMIQGGGGVKTAMLHEALQQLGVNSSIEENMWLASTLLGEAPSPLQATAIEKEKALRGAGSKELTRIRRSKGGLQGAAKATVSTYAPMAKRSESLVNQQIAAGSRMAGVVMQLETMATNTNKAFTMLAGEPLKKVVAGLNDLTDGAIKAANALTPKKGGKQDVVPERPEDTITEAE